MKETVVTGIEQEEHIKTVPMIVLKMLHMCMTVSSLISLDA